jgi:tetratricopeptide (TPR) repeat protein
MIRLLIGPLTLALLAAGCVTPKKTVNLAHAQAAFNAGEFDRCIEICRSAIDSGQDSVRARMLRGRAYERSGEHARAITDFERVRRLEPMRAEASFRQARCHVALGQFGEAETTMEWCVGQMYDSLSARDQCLARAVYGEVFLAEGEYAKAAQEFEAALKVAASSRSLSVEGTLGLIHYNLSRCHFERSNYRRARDSYVSYLSTVERGGGKPGGDDLYTLAVLHFLSGEVRLARELGDKLPAESKTRLEEVLSGEAFSVRALYDQSRKDKQEDHR